MSRIMIVDDEKSIRLTLREFLLQAGYEVEIAEDAPTATQMLLSGAFDVVVSDIIMPRMTGVELLHMIRQASPRVQVIMMTGEPTVETAAKAVQEGAFDYISKPVTKDTILRAVGNAAKVKALDDERERLSIQNQEYQTNLERLVVERTHELQQALDDLRQTQNQVIKQERINALGQMAGGIAHDFNNVLMPILCYSELLATRPAMLENKQEAKDCLESIYRAARQAKGIVQRLREFYKGGEQIKAEPTDLTKLIAQVVKLTKPKWKTEALSGGRKIEIRTTLKDVPSINAEQMVLGDALTNLLLNAVDAMPLGGTILIECERIGEDVTIAVSDTGQGMTEDIRMRCLEPFYTTKGEQGSGQGLTTVQGVVKRHMGTMDLRSEPGKGTTVTIRLPINPPVVARKTPEALKAVTSLPVLRVLVIAADDTIRKVFERQLRMDGHAVTVAGSGREGLEKAGAGPFDLAILDHPLGDMSSDALALALRRCQGDLRVIEITPFERKQDAQTLPPNVDAIIAKPVEWNMLHETMAQVVCQTRNAR